jgi:hypothetical protein
MPQKVWESPLVQGLWVSNESVGHPGGWGLPQIRITVIKYIK